MDNKNRLALFYLFNTKLQLKLTTIIGENDLCHTRRVDTQGKDENEVGRKSGRQRLFDFD